MSAPRYTEHLHPDIEKIVINHQELEVKIKELGEKISKDFADSKDLVVVGILKGSFLFMSDLVRHINIPSCNLTCEFMAVSSYGSGTRTTGNVRIIMDLRSEIANKDVLIVEDIIDSGYTLKFLKMIMETRAPKSLKLCTLIRKPSNLKVEGVTCDYVGFDIDPIWIVGYGLDYNEKYRTLPYLGQLKESVYKKE